MMHIILFEPEIPPNTGNIIRLAANTGAELHLIGQLGFSMNDKRMRRAGLDYHEYANIKQYTSFDTFLDANECFRLYAVSTKGTTCYSEISYCPDDYFIFGPETRGLPDEVLSNKAVSDIIRIPMKKQCRSINLANAVSIVIYEAWRQNHYAG